MYTIRILYLSFIFLGENSTTTGSFPTTRALQLSSSKPVNGRAVAYSSPARE